VHGVISTLTNSFMINHPIGEKWKERLVKEVTDSDGRLMPLTAISFIENLLEQERKTYEAKKADYEFRSVGKWVDYHSRMGATIIVKNNLPVEARYENPIHSVIRAGLSLRNK
jgi:hypothetical protein